MKAFHSFGEGPNSLGYAALPALGARKHAGGRLSPNFPRVNAVVWFNWRIDGDDWEIESSASSQAAFAEAVASSYYAPGGGFGNLPLLGNIKPLQ
jgi:hypothetical protein